MNTDKNINENISSILEKYEDETKEIYKKGVHDCLALMLKILKKDCNMKE